MTKNGIPIPCYHCEDGCWHCEGTGQQWLYPRGAIAREYTGLLDGKLSYSALRSMRTSRVERRAKNAEKRKYERRRKQFDKWADPKGPKPIKKERSTVVSLGSHQPSLYSPDDDPLIVDIHHGDRKTKVLYEEREFRGEFSFRDTILEQLDRYLVYVARMKNTDPQAYHLYKQIGAILVPYASNADLSADLWGDVGATDRDPHLTVSPWFLKILPSFGCIAYGVSPEVEKLEGKPVKTKVRWLPKFMYFTKYEKPPVNLEWRNGGTYYTLTVYWDKPGDKQLKRGGIPQEIGMFVSNNGSIRTLKSIETKTLKYNIPQRAWRIPTEFQGWAKQHDLTTQKFMADFFHSVGNYIERSAHAMIRVEARKNGLSCCFNVDLDRVPYFFSDRDYALTPTGFRKPIFHIVRAHQRANGSSVRLHFRGQKQFSWADYQIYITVPGRDHKPIEEIDVGACDISNPEMANVKGKFFDSKEIGKQLREYLRTNAQKG